MPLGSHQALPGTDPLVHAARRGDTWAWYRLVETYQGMIYAMVLRSGLREPPEDVLQEVFLKIHKSLEGFRGDCAFRTWVYQITLNTIRSFGRKASATREINDSALSGDSEAEGDSEGFMDRQGDVSIPDPLVELHQDRMRQRVREAFSLLQPREREILMLREIRELSYEEIAAILHLEIGTVKSRISRSRRSLHLQLGRLGATP